MIIARSLSEIHQTCEQANRAEPIVSGTFMSYVYVAEDQDT